MSIYSIDGYMGEPRPGVSPVERQDVSHVAGESTAPQAGEDIFKPYESPEVDRLRAEIDASRQECSELWAEMYPYTKPGEISKTPKYKRQAEIKARLEELERKQGELQATLREVLDSLPEGKPVGVPFQGSAAKVISPDQGGKA